MEQGKLRFSRLLPARFLRRENRFRAEIELDGQVVKSHVPNSGRMAELLFPGNRVWVQAADNPARKTPYSLMLVQQGEGYVCLNAHLANHIFALWLEAGILPEFQGVTAVCREKTWGNSRFDFQLEREGECWLVEVKSVNLLAGRTAKFPDAPTVRGSKHLQELSRYCQQGGKSAVVFIVMGNRAESFAPNAETDRLFAHQLQQARQNGVLVYVYRCRIDLAGVTYDGRIEF